MFYLSSYIHDIKKKLPQDFGTDFKIFLFKGFNQIFNNGLVVGRPLLVCRSFPFWNGSCWRHDLFRRSRTTTCKRFNVTIDVPLSTFRGWRNIYQRGDR